MWTLVTQNYYVRTAVFFPPFLQNSLTSSDVVKSTKNGTGREPLGGTLGDNDAKMEAFWRNDL